MSADTRECPFCAETIEAAALRSKCKHCGEFLEGGWLPRDLKTNIEQLRDALLDAFDHEFEDGW